MTFLDNIADYLPDEADLTDNDTISELVSIDKHIIITGWSEKDWNSLNDCFSNAFSFCGTNKLSDKVSDFYCLELSLAAGDDSISDSDDVILINNLKPILNCCLKCFNNYINVALAYKIRVKEENGKTSDKISYYYQTRVTGNELEHQVELLRTELEKSIPQNINLMYNALVYKDISKHYLYPGIELVSGKIIEEHVLKYLSHKIKKSILFFDLPYSVLSNTFHLYHHPKNSFPLPILLKSKEGMSEYVELWKKGIGWEDEEYNKYLDDLKEFNKFIVLGYYTREDEDGCKGPHIVLCPENIEDAASDSNLKDKKELLYLIVLIHELAHAMMDKNHVSLNSLFSNAMEESLANMITLQWFDALNRSNYHKVKSFVETQPKIYKFGINQFQAGVDWTKWRDSKKMHKLLKEWFKNCFVKRINQPQKIRAEYNRVLKQAKKQK